MLDAFSKILGKDEEISKMTRGAMSGRIPFRESFASRLSILNPTRDEYEKFTEQFPIRITLGAKELIERLHLRGVDVYLVRLDFIKGMKKIMGNSYIGRSLVALSRLSDAWHPF